MHTSLIQLAADLRSGRLPLLDYLTDLETYFNQREPQVLAFVPEEGRFERLRADAEALLAQYPDPASRPSLFGVPIGVKDIFHVDGFITQAGSQLPSDVLQGPEAVSVSQLKAAGALILGKTTTTEFAYFAPTPTHNPVKPNHTPGGSSSGSAAAVGAGLSPLTFGTQTIGSISRPASYCGAVGYKPSHERVSREGVIPLSPSVDHIGVFTPTVADLALVLPELVAKWDDDISAEILPQPVLAIPTGPYLTHADADAQSLFQAACVRLREAGYEVKSVPAMESFDAIVSRHRALVAADCADVHTNWYAEFGELYHPKTAELIEQGQQVDAETVAAARLGRDELRAELMALMDTHGIDLWLSPAAPGLAPAGLDSTGDPIMNLPWTHAGLPTLSVPCGLGRDGLPFGLQIAARFNADEALVAWGTQIEAAL